MGDLQMGSLIEKVLIKRWAAHETRVRCLGLLSPQEPSEPVSSSSTTTSKTSAADSEEPAAAAAGEKFLVSASSSDNKVKVWRVTTDSKADVLMAGEVDTSCRITSMCVWHPGMRAAGKKRKKDKSRHQERLFRKEHLLPR